VRNISGVCWVFNPIKLSMSDLSFRRVWLLALSARVAARAFVFNVGGTAPMLRPPQSEIGAAAQLAELSAQSVGSCCRSTCRSFANDLPTAPQLDTVNLVSFTLLNFVVIKYFYYMVAQDCSVVLDLLHEI
jgi:hypothetical protein